MQSRCALVIRILAVALVVSSMAGCRARETGAPAAPVFEPATYDASYFAALRWRSLGPNRGGRSIASAGSPSRPLEYYFGAVGGGLWKTTDGGATWNPVTDGQIKSSSVGAVAVAESDPDVIYIGMGEACLRGNIMQGDGVYRSNDAGRTWTHTGLVDSQAIARIRVHPRSPDLVYVAAFGHPSAPNDERGVFRSKDGGKTWQKILSRDNKTGAVDLVLDRNNPNVLYAALWEAYRYSYQMSSGGPGSGLFKSTDGGDHWTEITRNAGLPKGLIGRIGVSVSGADSRRVYALVEAEDGGLFRSDDAGATWTRLSDDRRLRQRAFYYTHVFADPKDRDTVYALNTGFYKSTDGGKTYTTIQVPHGDNHDLWIDPNNPLRMVNSNDGGGTVSFNGGRTWTDEEYPTAQPYHVITTKDIPYHVCGAQQDNSTMCVPSDEGVNFRDPRARPGDWLYAVGGGESGYIAPHPTDPNIFYAGSQGALLTKYDRRTGHTRDIQPYPRFFSGESASSLPERWQWTFPIVFSPIDAEVLYTCSQHVWKTTDDGQTWERISPDLTRADPKTLGDSGGPITRDQNGPEIFGTVFALAPSFFEKDTIWAGSDDGMIHVTRDGGDNWEDITPKDLPAISRVSIIDASPHRPGSAYVAVKRYLQDDRAPYAYRTDDYGKTWTTIVNGIRADDYVHVVREDPKRAGLLYAGTEHGVYVSFDNGATWQSLSLNLPDTQVPDLVVEENDLVIATHGRSFYVLDNIWPLRQLTSEVAAAGVRLFQPPDATRRFQPATIDYYLKRPAGKISMEILDATGQVIRSFTGSAEDDKQPRPAPEPGAPPPPLGVAAKAGLNRLAWDLRHPPATPLPRMFMRGATPYVGPWAVPGAYQVRLTVDDGQPQTRSFSVKPDPRLPNVTQADLQAQFDLAVQVRNRTSEAHEAVMLAGAIRHHLGDRVAKAKNAVVTAAAEALAKKLSEVEGAIYQVRLQSAQDLFHWPIKLDNRLAGLERVIENADARPTEQCRTMFDQLNGELTPLLAKLEAAVKTDLAQFNTLVQAQGLEPIQAELPRPVTGG